MSHEVVELQFNRDGSHVDVDEVFMTILDEDGKRSEKVQSFYLDKDYSKFRVEIMEIIKPNGKRIPVDLKSNSREETPTSDTEANIYDPNRKILKIFLPDLKIGDTIHYKVKRDTFKSTIPNHVYGMVLGQYIFPVKYYSFTIKGPADLKLYTLVKDKVKGTVTSKTWAEGTTQARQWIFRDVPQLTPEPSMPSFMRVVMRLLYSTLPSWEAASRWYYQLTEPKLKPTPAITAKVHELTKGLNNDDAKIKALFYFVAQKIRYMGITAEKNRPGFEPHEVGLTFSRRYGVCRDKAALLVSMLRVAGFRANMVLVNVGGKLDKEIPVPYFNHAVVVLRDESGGPLLYMDPTSETSKQFFPDYERDSSCLIADKKGEPLRLTPSLPPDRNLYQLVIRDVFSTKHQLYGRIDATCTGFVDTVFRSILMLKGQEEQRDFIRRMFLGRYPGIVITRISLSNPADRSHPFSFSLDFQIDRPAVVGKDGLICLLPLSDMPRPGVLDAWILGKANMVKRRFPLRFGYTYKTRIIEAIHFTQPPEEIRLPAIPNIANDVVDARTSFTLKKGATLVINREFALKKLEVTPQQYQDILRVQHARRQRVTLPIILRSEK
ncbi:MAG: hypothetical protein DSY91_00200 [Deltaproteobacteria bacterium]|nr:MAG: hypothetical protein DSY91_00200 [Deltaproteobacteria bacterium]